MPEQPTGPLGPMRHGRGQFPTTRLQRWRWIYFRQLDPDLFDGPPERVVRGRVYEIPRIASKQIVIAIGLQRIGIGIFLGV